MVKLIIIFFILCIGLLAAGSWIRQSSVDEEFTNEKGIIRIKTKVNNQSRFKSAQRLYGASVACFIIGIILAFYYNVYL
jgi:hypothetical protein